MPTAALADRVPPIWLLKSHSTIRLECVLEKVRRMDGFVKKMKNEKEKEKKSMTSI
jgi:hypothetical protein